MSVWRWLLLHRLKKSNLVLRLHLFSCFRKPLLRSAGFVFSFNFSLRSSCLFALLIVSSLNAKRALSCLILSVFHFYWHRVTRLLKKVSNSTDILVSILKVKAECLTFVQNSYKLKKLRS